MRASLTRRLLRGAEAVRSYAAFCAASEIVAQRHGLPAEIVRRGPTPEQIARLVVREAETRRLAAPDAEVASIRALATARREAFYLAHITYGAPMRSLARAAGVSHAAVRKALEAVEWRRTDPAFDRALDEAELQLMGEPT